MYSIVIFNLIHAHLSFQFADKSVSMAAVDMMCLLVEVALPMRQLYPSMPIRVLEALCYAIAIFMTDEGELQASWVDKVRLPFPIPHVSIPIAVV